MILKCFAVILALGILGGYVWTRQRAVAPASAASPRVDEETGFPITPATPTLFDTSKSGKLKVDPVLFSTSKSGPVDLGVTLVPEGKVDPLVIVDPETESEDAPAPILMPGSKSINMPLFNTKEVSKAITIWDGQTVKDTDSESTKKEKPKGTQK